MYCEQTGFNEYAIQGLTRNHIEIIKDALVALKEKKAKENNSEILSLPITTLFNQIHESINYTETRHTAFVSRIPKEISILSSEHMHFDVEKKS